MREPKLGRPPLPAVPLLELGGRRQDAAGLGLGQGLNPDPEPEDRALGIAPAAGAPGRGASSELRGLNASCQEHALKGLVLTGALACAGTISGRCPCACACACDKLASRAKTAASSRLRRGGSACARPPGRAAPPGAAASRLERGGSWCVCAAERPPGGSGLGRGGRLRACCVRMRCFASASGAALATTEPSWPSC